MFIGKVTGSVVSTQKTDVMTGAKMLVVEPYRIAGDDRDHLDTTGRTFVAVDTLGAGEGEMVLVVQGSSARMTPETKSLPVQIGIIGDPVTGDTTHRRIIGEIAWSSKGRIAYYPYSDELCMLGYAAANDVFGASLFEPCGQIDQVGNLYGATATNRKTGGYASKIKPMRSPDYSSGNGFLFDDYDTGGLLYGMRESLGFSSLPREIRLPQMQRIMHEARDYNWEDMVDAYVDIYENLMSLSHWWHS